MAARAECHGPGATLAWRDPLPLYVTTALGGGPSPSVGSTGGASERQRRLSRRADRGSAAGARTEASATAAKAGGGEPPAATASVASSARSGRGVSGCAVCGHDAGADHHASHPRWDVGKTIVGGCRLARHVGGDRRAAVPTGRGRTNGAALGGNGAGRRGADRRSRRRRMAAAVAGAAGCCRRRAGKRLPDRTSVPERDVLVVERLGRVVASGRTATATTAGMSSRRSSLDICGAAGEGRCVEVLRLAAKQPLNARYAPWRFGAVSDKLEALLDDLDGGDAGSDIRAAVYGKYARSLAAPGEQIELTLVEPVAERTTPVRVKFERPLDRANAGSSVGLRLYMRLDDGRSCCGTGPAATCGAVHGAARSKCSTTWRCDRRAGGAAAATPRRASAPSGGGGRSSSRRPTSTWRRAGCCARTRHSRTNPT